MGGGGEMSLLQPHHTTATHLYTPLLRLVHARSALADAVPLMDTNTGNGHETGRDALSFRVVNHTPLTYVDTRPTVAVRTTAL